LRVAGELFSPDPRQTRHEYVVEFFSLNKRRVWQFGRLACASSEGGSDDEKGRPDSGRHSKQKMYSAHTKMPFPVRFVFGHDRLQVVGHLGDVLRGFTQHLPSSHATAWRIANVAILHLISVRTRLVRRECYYILC
jgi:hypothetical protein